MITHVSSLNVASGSCPRVEAMLEEFKKTSLPTPVRRVPRVIREVIHCIHENLFDPSLNVNTVKTMCRIRDNNISSRFRCVFGVGIKDYIEALRMEAAGLVLAEGSTPVFDIATAVGYEYPTTFYRAFHRRFKCTPLEYRMKESSIAA